MNLGNKKTLKTGPEKKFALIFFIVLSCKVFSMFPSGIAILSILLSYVLVNIHSSLLLLPFCFYEITEMDHSMLLSG